MKVWPFPTEWPIPASDPPASPKRSKPVYPDDVEESPL